MGAAEVTGAALEAGADHGAQTDEDATGATDTGALEAGADQAAH